MCNGSSFEHSQLLTQVQQPAGVGSESLLLSFLLFLYLWPTLRKEKTEKKKVAVSSLFSRFAEANFVLTGNTDTGDFYNTTEISVVFFSPRLFVVETFPPLPVGWD